jgi:FMN phosphatase YigB (HAD superfamily)
MRAKTVNQIKKAYCFDFDDTLVKTDAKVYVYKRGKLIKSLTPEQFNHYIKAPDEEIDISEFKDPRLILSAKKYKMWPALQNMNNAIRQGRSSSEIFILTARSAIAQNPIYNFLKANDIFIPEDHIITIGDDIGEINIPEEKKKVLKHLRSKFDELTFFDDNPKNIELAREVGGIRTRLIDSVNI